ncbi:MAG: sulfotransferase family protein [Gammaproteobacteria bacterium]|nr:sulfotransferase family protein [Gammaproteobacteria bacterium]
MADKVSPLNPLEIGALVALIDQDRLSDAELEARKLLTLHPAAGILWKILSVALVRQGKDALQALQKTTELLPKDSEAHRNLGAELTARGQWAHGLESLRRALALSPYDADCLVEAGDAVRALGRAQEAVPLYRRALELNPRLAEAHNNLGNAFLELVQLADAAACYRCALQLKPDDAGVLCNLGNVERLLGHLDEALALSRSAIARNPGLSAAHNNLGLILAGRGQREEAVVSYRHALALDPRYIDALNNLGNVLRDNGQRSEAVALYARAIELDPSNAESHWNLGTVLFELRRSDEAAASYARSLALKPDYAPAHLSLGLALRQQRRPAEAEASCQAALAIDPDYVEALSFLGELRADRGRFSEAEELFQRAIRLDPEFAFAYFSIATHRKMTNGDGAWLNAVETVLAKRLPLGHEISLRYALGKYFDDVGQHDRAFDNYRQANELTKRYGSTYDREKLTRTVDQIIRAFDAAFIERCASQGSTSELPVLIVGMPRSGTSLTEQILASHPAVFGAGELPFWGTAFAAFAKGHGGALANLLPDVTRDYLERLTASAGGALRVVDKMPANFLYAGLIHAALPRARIIHMQRHPIDTCLSIYFQNFFSMGPYANDLGNLAHYYGEYIRIMGQWRATLPSTALLEVPYEALLEDQEGWTRRMLDFIGLPWDPSCLEFHRTDRVVITASKWQVRQKINAASAGRWRNYEKFVGPLRGLLNLPARHQAP